MPRWIYDHSKQTHRRLKLEWKRFWRLLVTDFDWIKKWHSWWRCECDCWKYIITKGARLSNWETKSCWCLQKDRASNYMTTHWMSKKRIYSIYKNIKKRCYDENHNSYKNYWGRGIKCKRESSEAFLRDMLPSYIDHVEEYWEKQTTIDRYPDKNWDYCKENCRRATYKEQNNNKRSNVLYPKTRWEVYLQRE